MYTLALAPCQAAHPFRVAMPCNGLKVIDLRDTDSTSLGASTAALLPIEEVNGNGAVHLWCLQCPHQTHYLQGIKQCKLYQCLFLSTQLYIASVDALCFHLWQYMKSPYGISIISTNHISCKESNKVNDINVYSFLHNYIASVDNIFFHSWHLNAPLFVGNVCWFGDFIPNPPGSIVLNAQGCRMNGICYLDK